MVSDKSNHRRKEKQQYKTETQTNPKGNKLWKQIRKRRKRKENNEVIQEELNYIKDLIDGRKFLTS